MAAKTAAHIAGLGVGFLPSHIAEREVAAGRLTILPVENNKASGDVLVAWRSNRTGKALRWFLQQLQQADVAESLLRDQAESSAGNENPPAAVSSKTK